MRMNDDDMNRFVTELVREIKTGQPTSHTHDRVWDVTESDLELIKSKFFEELYAPVVIDFDEWKKKKGR